MFGDLYTASLLHTKNIIMKTKFYLKWSFLNHLENVKKYYRYLIFQKLQ